MKEMYVLKGGIGTLSNIISRLNILVFEKELC